MAERKLDELLAIPGVVAAGRFQRDGQLRDYVSNRPMPRDIGEDIAQFCATVTMLFDTLAEVLSMKSGEWTVAIGGDVGVFARTTEVDLTALHKALAARRPTVPRI